MTTPLPSLRRRMLRQVLVPLALTWLAGSGVAVTLAYRFTRDAFDRSLLDDAYELAANVSADESGMALTLSPREVAAVMFDQNERQFYAVVRPDGTRVAGEPGLYAGAPPEPDGSAFADRRFRGMELRVAMLARSRPQPFIAVVGQTVGGRREHLGRLVLATLVPQLALLALLGAWLRRRIDGELAPLAQLQGQLDARGAGELAPLAAQPATRDLERLVVAFNGLLSRVATGVRAQREFAGNVAHELRNPLAGIRSLAEYGLAQRDPAMWRHQLERVVASEQRASHLVDQLLALARADESREGLQLEAVDADEVVHDLLLRHLPRADAAGVDLGAVGLEKPLAVRATLPLLEGLLGNLLDNALRHGRPRDPACKPRVTVALSAEGEGVRLSVSDNGPGMDEAGRERVLHRWERGTQPTAGSGLGLAIVRRYVELLGGRFDLGPCADGPGLCATVWLARA
ncbi:MAG: sensor histidine kinase [Rubrivivax sp.]